MILFIPSINLNYFDFYFLIIVFMVEYFKIQNVIYFL